MEIKKIKPIEEKKEVQEEQEEIEDIKIVQIATSVEDQFQTPGGVMNTTQYLAWIGNEIIKIRKAIG